MDNRNNLKKQLKLNTAALWLSFSIHFSDHFSKLFFSGICLRFDSLPDIEQRF
jgi:hypothetical protein